MLFKHFVLIVFFLGSYFFGNAFGQEEPASDIYEMKSVLNSCFSKITKLENKLYSLEDSLDAIKSQNIHELTTRLETLHNKFDEISGASGNSSSINKNNETESRSVITHSVDTEEKELAKLIAKVNSLEMKNEDSFETIEILKDGVAELRKNLEKQAIDMEIFEKYLMKIPKPDNSQEKSLEAQLNVISDIVVKHDKQLAEKEDVITIEKDKTITIDDDTKNEGQVLDVFDIEGYNNLGKGFYSKDIRFSLYGSSITASGIILNASGKDYSVANVKLMLFDKKNTLLWEQNFSVVSISNGMPINFTEILTGGSAENIKDYALVFGKQTKPTKFFKFELDEDNPYENNLIENNLSEKTENINTQDIKEEELETRKIQEEFKSIGGDFFVKDVNISNTEFICEVTGFIKNSSHEYYGLALFLIQLFDNKNQVIAEEEFTINFSENELKDFRIDILDVNVKELDSYIIEFKEKR